MLGFTSERRLSSMRLSLPLVGLVTTLPLVIFAVAMIVVVNLQQQRSVEDRLQQATFASVRDVDDRVLATQSALEMLATSNVFGGPEAAIADRVQRALRRRTDWLAVELRGRDGSSRTYRPRVQDAALVGVGPEETRADAVFRYGEPRAGGIITASGLSEPVVPVSVPLFSENGVSHVLTAYIGAWTINRALRDQGLSPGWILAVIDDKARFLARTLSDEPNDPVLGTLPDPSVIDGLRQGTSFFFAKTRYGQPVYSAVATSALTGWTVMLGAPASEINVATRWTVFAAVGGGATALALTLGMGAVLARSYARRERAERQMTAMAAASSAERRAAAILESTTDGVLELDRDWRITFINEQGRQLLANGRDLTGCILWEDFPEALDTTVWHEYHRAVAEQTPVEFEDYYSKLDRWYAVRAFPSTEGLAVYIQNITERKKLQDDLRRQQVVLDRVMETLPVGVFVIDTEGRFMRINAAALRIWGGWRDVGLDDYREYRGWWKSSGRRIESHEWGSARALALGETSLGEVIDIEGFDGSRKTILNSALPVRDDAGAIIAAVAVMEDITERLEAERLLLSAKEEAEQAMVAKSRFLASASHDLRQPMQSLFLFAGLLDGHVQDENGQEALRKLEQGLEAMKSLLDGLLDVSRLDAGVVQPTIEDFPIADLLDHIAASYAPVAGAKGLEWRMTTCPYEVRSDRVLLGRIVRNLVENAIRYTHEGSIEIECRQESERVRIEVRDTGIGIPPDQLRQVFDEFHQVGNPERDRSQGLGLGLAIVQRIGRLLNHPVDVTSDLGRGSTFSVEVPGSPVCPPPEEKEARANTRTGNAWPGDDDRLVVVIDDDASVLFGLEAILRDWGCEVIAAGSAAKAVEKLRAANRKPDLVVADYRLRAGEIGTEAILAVRGLLGVEIPGVIVTGETGPECQRDAARHGFGLMHKPVTPRQLRGTVERYLKDSD